MMMTHKKVMILLLPVLLAIVVFVTSRRSQRQGLANEQQIRVDSTSDITVDIQRIRKQNVRRGDRHRIVTAKELIRPRKQIPRALVNRSLFENATVSELLERLKSDDANVLSLSLLAAQTMEPAEVIRFADQGFDQTNGQLRRDCFELLVGYNDPAILPVVEKAFYSGDNDLRRAALEALENVGSPAPDSGDDAGIDAEIGPDMSDAEREQILHMLVDAFNDPDRLIRDQALQTLLQLPLDLQVDGFAYAQESSYDDVRADVVHYTSTSANWDTLYIAIKALDDASPEIRDQAANNLDFYISKSFNSSLDALNWWLKNNQYFDEDLFIIDIELVELVQPLPGM